MSRGRKKKDFFDNLFGNQNDLGSGSMDFPSFDMDISGMDVSDIGNINDGMPRVSTRTPTIPTAKRPKTSQITSFDFMQNKKRFEQSGDQQSFVQRQSGYIIFNRENVEQLPNESGQYEFYDSQYNLLYTGVTKYGLKHRISSYYQDDDFKEHKTKKVLRGKIKYFKYRIVPIDKAREIEHKVKKSGKYNYS